VRHDATRKAVLQRADGVVFVADSHIDQMSVNYESFANLENNLALVGLSIEHLPLVVQFNKRDLSNIVSEIEIRNAWGPSGLPVIMSSAVKGWGVLDTFREILGRMFDAIDARYNLTERFGVERDVLLSALLAVRT
jgi:signal recognition particle receptor subunit beta